MGCFFTYCTRCLGSLFKLKAKEETSTPFLSVDLFWLGQELHVRTQANKCLSTKSELPVRPFSLPCYPAVGGPLATPAPHTHLSAQQTSRYLGTASSAPHVDDAPFLHWGSLDDAGRSLLKPLMPELAWRFEVPEGPSHAPDGRLRLCNYPTNAFPGPS
jgi:hypothetical protein